ncbi:hypothetical protein BH18THE1_BH18THE1_20850 [soil metagenome]
MSIHYEGKCDNCGKENLRVTVDVDIHDTLGTLGMEEWCLECVRGKGMEKKSQKNTRKWPAT